MMMSCSLAGNFLTSIAVLVTAIPVRTATPHNGWYARTSGKLGPISQGIRKGYYQYCRCKRASFSEREVWESIERVSLRWDYCQPLPWMHQKHVEWGYCEDASHGIMCYLKPFGYHCFELQTSFCFGSFLISIFSWQPSIIVYLRRQTIILNIHCQILLEIQSTLQNKSF